jgi:hypothetical protein
VKILVWALVLMAVALLVAAVVLKRKTASPGRPKGRFESRPPLTRNEQTMYWRLLAAFPPPDYVVLAEVSFGALLVAKGGATRYSFSQKRADFVLLDRSFLVLAIIELDDNSHDGKEDRDDKRDAMLTSAGYKVLRFRKVPDAERLQAAVNRPAATPRAERVVAA